jgi:hypothetical protein
MILSAQGDDETMQELSELHERYLDISLKFVEEEDKMKQPVMMDTEE